MIRRAIGRLAKAKRIRKEPKRHKGDQRSLFKKKKSRGRNAAQGFGQASGKQCSSRRICCRERRGQLHKTIIIKWLIDFFSFLRASRFTTFTQGVPL